MTILEVSTRRFLLPAVRRNFIGQNTARRTMMAFEDHARLKGKFEEDRYLKQQEEKWYENLRKLRAQEEQDRARHHYEEVIEPVKQDFADLLAKTGDKISDEGLDNLAKFRLSL